MIMTKTSILAVTAAAFAVATLSACAPEAPAPTPTEQPALGGGDSTKNNNTKEK